MQQTIQPTKKLRGEVLIPGDKSISHRAVMLGSLAVGTTEITHFLNSADCLATINCFQKMGINIERHPNRILVHGKGLHGLNAPIDRLNVGNSGTAIRLLSGILAGQNFSSAIFGDESLNSRPMGRIIEPLAQMGADIRSINDNGCAPLKITPGTLHGICYDSPVASAQVKSAILLAGLYADSETSVTEPALSRNHTELMLNSFGASVTSTISGGARHITSSTSDKATAFIKPCKKLYAQKICIPGDISSAAYFIAAALLVPDSELLIKNVGINPTRAGFLKVCQNMGANITLLNESLEGGEKKADLLVKSSHLTGTVIEGSLIPTLIDEIPIIAVIASLAEGTTVIKDAAELKVKETNRIDTTTSNLKTMGADITPTEDGMIIEGIEHLTGTNIKSFSDHRIAMAFSVAGLIASGETIINNSQCVDISYPDFFKILQSTIR